MNADRTSEMKEDHATSVIFDDCRSGCHDPERRFYRRDRFDPD